jgi:hypothetical protein
MAIVNFTSNLVKLEIKTLEDTHSGKSPTDSQTTTSGGISLYQHAAIQAQIAGVELSSLKHMPELQSQLNLTRKIKAEKLRTRLNDNKFSKLHPAATPKYKFITQMDNSANSGFTHPSFNIIKDIVLWAETALQEDQDKGGSTTSMIGLPKYLKKIFHLQLLLRLQGDFEEVHSMNLVWTILELHTKVSREIALHYVQELVDELHLRSTIAKPPTLKEFFEYPHEAAVARIHQHVMETLRTRYPPKPQAPKVEVSKSDLNSLKNEMEKKLMAMKNSNRGNAPPKPDSKDKGGGRGRGGGGGRGDRGRSRSRSRSRERKKRRTPSTGRKAAKDSRRGGKGGDSQDKSSHTPELNKAWKLAQEKKLCGHFQKGLCRFGTDCKDPHRCLICNSSKHGAKDCPELHKARGQKLLGSEKKAE